MQLIIMRKEYDTYECPVTYTLNLISGRWKPLILYLIQHDVNRFGILHKKMPRISKKVLTEQLRELERENLINRLVIKEEYPQVVIYELTSKGNSLRELIDQIFKWGENNKEGSNNNQNDFQ